MEHGSTVSTLPQIEQLGEAMLDFQTRRELSAWLKQQRGQ
jgi:hypothetical protein